jgi:hypothetical protein
MVNISIDYNGRFLFCRVVGVNTVENVIHYLNDVHHAMEKHNCAKVLIEENLSGPGLSVFKMYQIIVTVKKTVLSLPHLIAYVDVNPEHDHKSLKFAETVALNRYINMHLFASVTAATDWLERVSL